MGVYARHRPQVEVREQLTGAGFLLPTMWVLGLGSAHQAWQQVLLPFELACQTDISWPLGLVLSVVTQFSTELRTWPI